MTDIDRSACPGHGKHGTADAVRKRGCTCPDGVKALRQIEKRWRLGIQPPALVNAAGTSRRIQALAAIGWSATALAPTLGCSPRHVAWLSTAHRDGRTVHRDTANRVTRLYDELSGTPGPSNSARIRARNAGWVPPLLWDDVDIDNPAAEPAADEPARSASRIRIDLDDVDHLERFGMSLEQIATRLGGVDVESIKRARQRANQQRKHQEAA